MAQIELETILTLALGVGTFFALSLLENIFRSKVSPGLRKYIWFLFILKMALPIGIFSPLIFQPPKEAQFHEVPYVQVATVPIMPIPRVNHEAPVIPVAQVASKLQDLNPWYLVSGAYFLGVLIILGFWVVRRLRIRALLAAAIPPEPELAPLFFQSKVRCGVSGKVELRVLSGLTAPMVSGIFRPVVYLPKGPFDQFASSEISLMLDHELQHLKAGDNWLLGLINWVQLIMWFHPGVWLAKGRFILALEEACDQRVIKSPGSPSPQFYGLTLLKVLGQGQSRLQYALSMASPRNQVKNRIRLLAETRKVTPWAVGIMATVLFGACAVGVPILPKDVVQDKPSLANGDSSEESRLD